jgi:hypothetical protein
MTERCKNCGAELFERQQFCRSCGSRTTDGLGGEAVTRMLPDSPATPAQGTTTTLPQRGTGETLWGPRHTENHGPIGHASYTSPLAAAPALAGASSKRSWFVPALLGLLLVAFAVGVFGLVWLSRSADKQISIQKGDIKSAETTAGDGLLDETDAEVTSTETVLTESFEVADSTAFSLTNSQGDITIEGWDENHVDLRVVKTGGSEADRTAARVTARQTDELLALSSSEASQVKVAYEVKIPRTLQNVEIRSRTADVKVSGLKAPLTISLTNGDISIDNVRGAIKTKLVNGDVDVVYRSDERAGAHEFTNVNGDISVRLAEGMGADLKASVVNGSLEVEDGLGIQPKKQRTGWSAEGQLGKGGGPIAIKLVNGDIKIEK